MLKSLENATMSMMDILGQDASMFHAKPKFHSIDGRLQMVGQKERKTRKAKTSTMLMRKG